MWPSKAKICVLQIALFGLLPNTCRAGYDTGYVDPSRCASCHPKITEDYARTGMGRSFRRVRSAADLREFDGKTFYHSRSEQYFTAYRHEGNYSVRRHQIGFDGSVTNVLETDVDYVFGSGNHARSYLHRTSGGKLIELPLTWYTEKGGYWAMNPAFDRPDHLGFSREITYRCMFCHNGYPKLAPGADDWDGASVFPNELPDGIDCQRCHGPGRDHVDAAQHGAARARVLGTIVNPSRLSSERRLSICMQCHLETTSARLPTATLRFGRGVFSYRPGEPLANYMLHFDHATGTGHEDKFELVSSAYRLRQSRCYQASAGSLDCTTCHAAHEPAHGEHATARYNQICRQCHDAALAKLVRDRRHPSAPACTYCHMPQRRPSDAIHIVMTDHYIRARPSVEKMEPLQEDHDGNTPIYFGEVAPYYPATLPATPENDLSLAIAQVKHDSNLPAGLRRLENAIQHYHPEQSEPYFELAEAYGRAGLSQKALSLYEQAARREPVRWYHLSALGIALAIAGQPGRSVEVMQRALSLRPRETTILFALGEVYSSQGRLQEAASTFRKASAIDSAMVEGPNNLGTTLLKLGDFSGAATALREAVRLRPENSATHLNLANVLSRMSRLPEAKYHLETAIRIGPSLDEARSAYAAVLVSTGNLAEARKNYDASLRRQLSDMHNNLGTTLAALGDMRKAIEEYRIAVTDNPASADANLNLGLTLAEQGRLAEARDFLETATKFDPNSFEAHLKLGEILLSQGQPVIAATHLRQAAQSPSAQVKKAASELLNRLAR